jgi:hypothetical protein
MTKQSLYCHSGPALVSQRRDKLDPESSIKRFYLFATFYKEPKLSAGPRYRFASVFDYSQKSERFLTKARQRPQAGARFLRCALSCCSSIPAEDDFY